MNSFYECSHEVWYHLVHTWRLLLIIITYIIRFVVADALTDGRTDIRTAETLHVRLHYYIVARYYRA